MFGCSLAYSEYSLFIGGGFLCVKGHFLQRHKLICCVGSFYSDKQSLIYTQTKADRRKVGILHNNSPPNQLERSNIQITKGPHYLYTFMWHVCLLPPPPPTELERLIVSWYLGWQFQADSTGERKSDFQNYRGTIMRHIFPYHPLFLTFHSSMHAGCNSELVSPAPTDTIYRDQL